MGVCVPSLVWVWVSLASSGSCLDLASLSGPHTPPWIFPPTPKSWDRLPSPLSATGTSLACSRNLVRRRKRQAGRQTSHTLVRPPAWHHREDEIGVGFVWFPCFLHRLGAPSCRGPETTLRCLLPFSNCPQSPLLDLQAPHSVPGADGGD